MHKNTYLNKLITAFVYYLFIDHIVFFINAITLTLIGPSPIDTILVYIIFAILLLRALPEIILSKINLLYLLIYFIIAFSILFGYMLYQTAYSYDLVLRVIFSSYLCIVIVSNINDLDYLVVTLLKSAKPLLIMMIIGFLLNQFVIGTEWLTNKMPFSYMFLSPVLLEIWNIKRKFNIKGLILIVISIMIMIIFGSRGPILSLVVYFILLFFTFHNVKEKFIKITLLFVLVLVLFSNYYEILDYIYNVGLKFGVESKVLSLLFQENIFFDNGRNLIYEKTWGLILESPILGKGMFADRYYFKGQYTHNIFLEILLNYGFIIGIIFIILLIYIIIKSFYSQSKTYKELIIFFISIGFIPLLVSGSFWVQKEFFALITLCLFQFNKIKINTFNQAK